MKKTLEALNRLKEKAIIKEYAIGGGVATIFYTEPVFTYDLDVFIMIKTDPEEKIISLSPIYESLVGRGSFWKGEHIVVEGFPVQFIPASSGLEKEAILNAKEVTYSNVKTRVLSAEYLIAIALKVGRRKDLEKVSRLLEQSRINKKSLGKILKAHGLTDRFKKWQEK